MKYNLTNDLSATRFGSYALDDYNPNSPREIDYKDCLFFEVARTLDKNKKSPKRIAELKYIYARNYRPYELFEYPYLNLHFKGKLSGGRVDSVTIFANEVSTDRITSHIIEVSSFYAEISGEFDSLSATSITAGRNDGIPGVSSYLGIIHNLQGNNIFYDDAKFGTITVTGIANLVAASAKWADVAELYYGDDHYEPGTLVKLGGVNELTLADDYANGCISEKPAVLMNNAIRKYINAIPLLLTGKTKVKVNGPIEKFDRIELSDIPGVARKHTNKQKLGIALETNRNEDTKLVECIIKTTL